MPPPNLLSGITGFNKSSLKSSGSPRDSSRSDASESGRGSVGGGMTLQEQLAARREKQQASARPGGGGAPPPPPPPKRAPAPAPAPAPADDESDGGWSDDSDKPSTNVPAGLRRRKASDHNEDDAMQQKEDAERARRLRDTQRITVADEVVVEVHLRVDVAPVGREQHRIYPI